MPFIICPECNKVRPSKLVGDHTLQTWASTYGDKPAPVSCFEANLMNSCVRKHEAKLKEEKQAKAKEVYLSKREITLTTPEVKELLTLLNMGCHSTEPHKALKAKLEEFLSGDNTFAIMEEDSAKKNF